MKYIYLNNYITDDNKIYRDILRNASIRMDWRNFLYISFAITDVIANCRTTPQTNRQIELD